MNVAAGPELAAAVTNAGGLGVIGGVGYTPKVLRNQVRNLLLYEFRIEPNPEWRLLDTCHQEGFEGQERALRC